MVTIVKLEDEIRALEKENKPITKHFFELLHQRRKNNGLSIEKQQELSNDITLLSTQILLKDEQILIKEKQITAIMQKETAIMQNNTARNKSRLKRGEQPLHHQLNYLYFH